MDFCNELAEDEDEEEDDQVDLNDQKQKDAAQSGQNGQKEAKARDSGETATQVSNKETLMQIREATGCAIIPAETAIELYNEFAKKEYAARVKSRMKM